MKQINKSTFKVPLGCRVKDKITGFEGIVISRSQWLNNCNTYGVKPSKLKDDKPIDTQWFDEPQLKIVEEDVFKPKQKTGGPCESVNRTNR